MARPAQPLSLHTHAPTLSPLESSTDVICMCLALGLLKFAHKCAPPHTLKLCMCVYRGCICTVSHILRSAHVPTSGTRGWNPCLGTALGRSTRWHAARAPLILVRDPHTRNSRLAADYAKSSHVKNHGPQMRKQVSPVGCVVAFAPKFCLKSILIPYFDREGGLARRVVTKFRPQIGP